MKLEEPSYKKDEEASPTAPWAWSKIDITNRTARHRAGIGQMVLRKQ